MGEELCVGEFSAATAIAAICVAASSANRRVPDNGVKENWRRIMDSSRDRVNIPVLQMQHTNVDSISRFRIKLKVSSAPAHKAIARDVWGAHAPRVLIAAPPPQC